MRTRVCETFNHIYSKRTMIKEKTIYRFFKSSLDLRYRLLEASLDAAVLAPTHSPPLATGVEICQCPPEYNGTSCQDPSIGFYRWYKNTTTTSTIVIDLVGQAKRCQCNGRSDVCDIETGYCTVSITETSFRVYILHGDNI